MLQRLAGSWSASGNATLQYKGWRARGVCALESSSFVLLCVMMYDTVAGKLYAFCRECSSLSEAREVLTCRNCNKVRRETDFFFSMPCFHLLIARTFPPHKLGANRSLLPNAGRWEAEGSVFLQARWSQLCEFNRSYQLKHKTTFVIILHRHRWSLSVVLVHQATVCLCWDKWEITYTKSPVWSVQRQSKYKYDELCRYIFSWVV